LFRNLSLNGKVTMTLVGAFALVVGIFLLILYPFQRNQLEHLHALNRSLVANLVRSYHNRLLYDLYGRMDDSLILDLQELLSQDRGILFVRVLDPEGGVYASSEEDEVRTLFEQARDAGRLEAEPRTVNVSGIPMRPILLARRGAPVRIHGIGGGSFVDRGGSMLDELLTRAIADSGEGARFERREIGGTPAFVYEGNLEASDRVYGQVQMAYSLAGVERIRRQTQLIFYGLIGSFFIILLPLLNLLISRIVILPLQSVYRAMRDAGRGDLEQKLRVRSSDEIGKISSIFNQMVAKLRQSKEEIERYNRDLEGMVSDRTEKLRHSQESLTHLKNYLATLIESVGTGVLSVDREGRVTTFNEKAGELLAIDAVEAEGRPVGEVLAKGDLRRLAEVIEAARRSGPRPRSVEIEVRLPSGKKTFSVNVSALSGEAGENVGRVVVFDDVTQLIYTRTLTAWKEAVEKVIHEIKNPLTPIRLSTQQLRAAFADRSPGFDAMFERGTKNILASVESLQKLVSDFSHFYSLRPAKPEPLALSALADEVLSMYSQGLPPGIRIERTLAEGLPPLLGDPDHLKRVVANLVRNGIEAMEGKSGVLRVRTELRPDSDEVALVVSDEGRGIGADEMEKIFEPYFTTKIKGTGLGLIISKQIVEEHGGRILIRSDVGCGTTVEVLFPLR